MIASGLLEGRHDKRTDSRITGTPFRFWVALEADEGAVLNVCVQFWDYTFVVFPPTHANICESCVYDQASTKKKDRVGSVTFAFECFEKGKPSLGNFHMRNP